MHNAATARIPRHRVMFNRVRWLLLVISAAAMAGLIACGSETVDTQPASSTGDGGPSPDELATVSTTLYADRTFTLGDFTAAGWKKSKQFATDTVPGATDIWYGFYSQKDIEIRFYPSHAEAASAGAESAAGAIDQKFREGGQVGASNRGAGASAVTKYAAFAVLGNTVVLCELNLETCTTFAEALDGS